MKFSTTTPDPNLPPSEGSLLQRWIPVFFFSAISPLAFTACGDEAERCKQLLSRNKSCREAYSRYIRKISEMKMKRALASAPNDQVKEEMKKRIPKDLKKVEKLVLKTMAADYFLRECKKHLPSDKKKARAKKAKLSKCLSLKSCDAYVKCVMETIQVKRARRKTRPPSR